MYNTGQIECWNYRKIMFSYGNATVLPGVFQIHTRLLLRSINGVSGQLSVETGVIQIQQNFWYLAASWTQIAPLLTTGLITISLSLMSSFKAAFSLAVKYWTRERVNVLFNFSVIVLFGALVMLGQNALLVLNKVEEVLVTVSGLLEQKCLSLICQIPEQVHFQTKGINTTGGDK